MRDLTKRFRPTALVAALIFGSLSLTLYNAPTGVLQQSGIQSKWVPGNLPALDAESPQWKGALPAQVPLTRQNITQPMLTKPSTPSVMVRSLNNGTWIAFLLEWEAPVKHSSTTRVQDYTDGAAIQFPLKKGAPPFLGMGQANSPVNIWHWKADWQESIDSFFHDLESTYQGMQVDYYPFAKLPNGVPRVTDLDRTFSAGMASGNPFSLSQFSLTPIEDLSAAGFGTLTYQPHQDVIGKGVWSGERWRVIFARSMATGDSNDAIFESGGTNSVAFAIWQGGNREVDGKKSFSNWHILTVEPPGAAAPITLRSTTVLGVLLLSFGLGLSFYDRARRREVPSVVVERRRWRTASLSLATFLAIAWLGFFYLVVTGLAQRESIFMRNALLVQGAIALLVLIFVLYITRRLFRD